MTSVKQSFDEEGIHGDIMTPSAERRGDIQGEFDPLKSMAVGCV